MAFKHLRYRVFVPCTTCFGHGTLTTKQGLKRCPDCVNGERIKWINEVRHVNDDEAKAEAAR